MATPPLPPPPPPPPPPACKKSQGMGHSANWGHFINQDTLAGPKGGQIRGSFATTLCIYEPGNIIVHDQVHSSQPIPWAHTVLASRYVYTSEQGAPI